MTAKAESKKSQWRMTSGERGKSRSLTPVRRNQATGFGMTSLRKDRRDREAGVLPGGAAFGFDFVFGAGGVFFAVIPNPVAVYANGGEGSDFVFCP